MKLLGVLGVACLLLGASGASAVTFTILGTSGGPANGLGVGQTITIDVVATLDPGEDTNALGASAYDWSNAVINFTSGQAVGELFFQTAAAFPPTDPICSAFPAACLPADPITSLRGGALVEGTATAGTGFEGVPEVEFVAAIDLFNTFVPQAFSDPGLDGNAGTAQFQFVFTGVGPGSTTIIFGLGSDLDGVTGGPATVPNTNTSLTITVPEPGSFAATLASLGSIVGIVFIRKRKW